MVIHQRWRHNKKTLYLTLIALVFVNSLLAWHNVAHGISVDVAPHHTSIGQIPPVDNDCALCLSAHGLQHHTALTSNPLLGSINALAVFLLLREISQPFVFIHYRQQARAPPVFITFRA